MARLTPAPARIGTLETRKDARGRTYYRGRVRLQDGTLTPVDIPEQYIRSKIIAREIVTEEQRVEDDGHARQLAKDEKLRKGEAETASAAGETCAAWYVRFMVYRRKTLSASSVNDSFCRWRKWIGPHIAHKPITLVTPDDAEAVRDALNDAITAGKLAHRSAGDNWIVFTTAMKHASTRRGPPDLRVREAQGNPCLGIDPPRTGASKRRHWSRPAEIAAVLANQADVPLAWREAIAIGCYLHLRPGELEELRVKDFDLDVEEVHVRRAWDVREKKVKVPKTSEGVRHVTVPPTLMPLLRRIADRNGPEDLVAPVLGTTTRTTRRAPLFREFLRSSGVDRAELFVDTPTHEMIDFRSLRDTGITWRFLAGHRAEVVQREAGHEQISTTLGYAKEVSDRHGRFGEPFPSLPPDLGGPDAAKGAKEEPPTGVPVSATVSVAANDADQLDRHCVTPADREVQRRESTSDEVPKSSLSERLSTRSHVDGRTIDRLLEQRVGCMELDVGPRAAALAAAVEALSTGHARVLAAELRALLERAAGPLAEVIPMRGHEPKR